MSQFVFEAQDICGSYIIHSYCSEDNRGNFVKFYEKNSFLEAGIEFVCHESFISVSEKHVIRGMHFQTYHPQAKLVGVLNGKVYDVIVDLRKESPTFGQWRGYYLSAENRTSLLIPRGCAHGFIALSENSMVSYQCDGVYDKATDTGIRFDDKDINIEWPLNDVSQATLGVRDRKLMSFEEFRQSRGFIYA